MPVHHLNYFEGAVRIPTLPIPTVLSSYSRIAGLGWEPGYAVSYVSREAGKSCNYFPNMRCVQAGNMCEKYSEYAQICANNERKYANMREICAHSGDIRENMRYAHLAKICRPEECAPHSRNRNCQNRECRNRNLYPPSPTTNVSPSPNPNLFCYFSKFLLLSGRTFFHNRIILLQIKLTTQCGV